MDNSEWTKEQDLEPEGYTRQPIAAILQECWTSKSGYSHVKYGSLEDTIYENYFGHWANSGGQRCIYSKLWWIETL